MAIPPPPPGPPGPPPPPPIGGLKLGAFSDNKSSSGGDTRSALLQSIQKGAKLKKTVTIDKSGPILSGKVANTSAAPSRPPPPTAIGSTVTNGMPKLGGIFEGMSSMPKLKPVAGRTITNRTSPPDETPSNTAMQNNSIAISSSNSNGGVGDFNAELTKHLTLKKQKKQQQQQQSSNNSNETNSRINRGPPPQPPNKNPTTILSDNSTSNASIAGNSYLFKQQQQQNSDTTSNASTPVNGTNISIVPNKSSLFAKNLATTIDTSSNNSSKNTISTISNISSNNNNNNNNDNSNNISISTSGLTKSIPNHGKPNCAPKPPGIQQIIASKNCINSSLTTTTTNNTGNSTNIISRTVVSRHHSMRSPRSPPISVAGGPIFQATQQFGTMRGTPPSFQSQDAINMSIRQAPNPPISRPTVAPPRPPNIKPPPPPIRSISNTNLTTLPLSVPASVNANNFGSASNVSTLKEQFSIKAQSGATSSVNNVSTLLANSINTSKSPLNSTNNLNSNHGSNNNISLTKDRSLNGSLSNAAPPLPPHRTCPAPPPPIRQTSITPSNNSGAPPVPQRHSSMRNSNPNAVAAPTAATTLTSIQSTSSSHTIARFVVDLDTKLGHRFHNVTEFPAPSPFTNLPKSYPSRNLKATTETRKAKAPSPPVKLNETTSDTSDKYYLQLTDNKTISNDSSYC